MRPDWMKLIGVVALVIACVLVVTTQPVQLGLDLRGGTQVLLEAKDTPTTKVDRQVMEQISGVLNNRVNQMGLTEPIVQRQGDRRILVELPGMKDQDKALETIGKTALLEFKDAAGNVFLTGAELKDAQLSKDTLGRPAVSVELKPKGAKAFADFTSTHVGQPLSISLDGEILSSPVVREPITDGHGQISGQFTLEEASHLSLLLRAGALPVPIEVVQVQTIGPSLGKASIDTSVRAGILGLALTLSFMLIMYRGLGLMANLALGVYTLLVVAGLILMKATLTLPGIAGLILGIGMAVDGNVLIFERMKDELTSARSLRSAIEKGFHRAFSAIFDSNATTFLAATVLFFLSTGAVKGFAVTLALGVLASFFSAITVTRAIVKGWVSSPLPQSPGFLGLGRKWSGVIEKWNIVGLRRVWYTISIALLLAGLVGLGVRGPKFGLDFTGGTLLELQSQRAVAADTVRDVVSQVGIPQSVVQESGDKRIVVRAKEITPAQRDALVEKLQSEAGEVNVVRNEFVGPTIGQELKEKAILALALALLGQIIYVSFRFEFRFAVAAVAALFHDLLMLTGIFALLGREMDSTFLAALLTLIGYSINDTIVVFDRIRENRRLRANEPFDKMVNTSITQTFTRSMNTSFSVILVAAALFFLGGPTLNTFSLALLIGVISGTYSSVFTASPLLVSWYNRDKKLKGRLAPAAR